MHAPREQGKSKGLASVAKRWWFWLIVVIAVALVIVHIYLAIWVRDYVNRKLSEVPGYRAHVQAVTLHLWRGAYQIHNLDIKKTSGDVPVPFFSSPLIDLSVEWKALWDRAFVGEIDIYKAKMNLVSGKTKDEDQAPVDEPWAEKVKQLFPIKINRFAVHDSELHYRDFSKEPKVDVPIDDVQMVATNLTNSKKLSKTLMAEIEMTGRPLRSGNMRTRLDLDPYAAKPTFAVKLEIEQIPLVKLNDFAKAYGGFTFESGTFRMATECTSKNGAFNGYVEPVFDHMGIFNPEHDSQNPLSFVWQAILGGVTEIVRNHSKDRFGTRVPYSGTFDNPRQDVLTTVFNVFRNAFVKAFSGKLENEKIDLPSKIDPDKKE
ncbi:MAG TPA: DUF748 domain-containing protein [Chthoniobacterales bacterium]|nr:DUF748 domain-containing protein [Chthoniobacterales bacterium]